MAINTADLLALLPGRVVIVSDCEAREHGDNPGCVCPLKGKPVTVGAPFSSNLAGTPTWTLVGHPQRVRLSEITLLMHALEEAPSA